MSVRKATATLRALGFTTSFLVLWTLGGCAGGYTFTPPVAPASLERVETPRKITLNNNYDLKTTFANGIKVFTIVAGEYRAEFHGNGGTYYRGPSYAITEKFTQTGNLFGGDRVTSNSYEGGVFVPDTNTEAAKVYFYISSNPRQNDLVTTATNIAVPPTATPGQTLQGGIGAGIGAAIVAASIASDNGKLFFPPKQPDDQMLRNAFEW